MKTLRMIGAAAAALSLGGCATTYPLGTTITMDNPNGGDAKALLDARVGSGLRCDLRIGQGFGGGFCRDDAGRQYDVQLRTAPHA